jgi:hypothetical protein
MLERVTERLGTAGALSVPGAFPQYLARAMLGWAMAEAWCGMGRGAVGEENPRIVLLPGLYHGNRPALEGKAAASGLRPTAR